MSDATSPAAPATADTTRPTKAPLSTRTLLTCVAIAVVVSLLNTPAGWLSVATSAAFPPAFLAVSGLQIIGPVIALRLLSRGGVGLLTSALVGLIGVFTGPYGWGAMAVMMFGAIAEIPFLVNLYRRWSTWRYYVAAVLAGVIYTPSLFAAFDYASLQTWIQILTIAAPTLSMVLFTWLGLLVARGLQRAGVGPKTRVQAA